MNAAIRLVAVLFFLLPVSALAQASFDCAKAGTIVEHAICASSRLSALDRQLAHAYAAARMAASVSRQELILQQQRAWIVARDQCGGNVPCLEQAMTTRIGELVPKRQSPGVGAGLSGAYCAQSGWDQLLVEDYGDAIEFSFGSVQGNGHSCGTSRLRANRIQGGYMVREDGCTFKIRVQGSELYFSTNGEAACDSYCGARARFSTHVFDMSERWPIEPGWTSVMETGGC